MVPRSAARASRPIVAAIAIALIVAGLLAPPAVGAAGSVSLSVDPVPIAVGGTRVVTVRWTGQTPRQLVFIRVCNKRTAEPGFNDALDCSLLSELNPSGTPDGSGTAEVTLFRGPEPGGDNPWGCFARGDAPPPGITASTTCYVRVTSTVVSNDDDAVEAPFTIVDGPPDPASAYGGAALGAPADPAAATAPGATVLGDAEIRFAG